MLNVEWDPYYMNVEKRYRENVCFSHLQKVVTALDRTWHPEHFFCAQCGAFFGPEGELLLLLLLLLFSPLHSSVFSLQHCWGLSPCVCVCLGFHEKDGKAYCRKDYFDLFAPKCGGCARAILENYISALNSLWHPECFVCRVCTVYVFWNVKYILWMADKLYTP